MAIVMIEMLLQYSLLLIEHEITREHEEDVDGLGAQWSHWAKATTRVHFDE